MYEVELKFPLVDVAAVEAALGRLGAHRKPPIDQADIYFSHPTRDFALTDEALRLRRQGDSVAITWKGPRLGTTAKTRREIELPLAAIASSGGDSTLAAWVELLEALGFRRVREVVKRRRPAAVVWQGSTVEVAIDSVAGLGDFLELEIVSEKGDIPLATARIESLAAAIGLGTPQQCSYLELILRADSPG